MEAEAWVKYFEARAAAIGEEIQAEVGEDATVSVLKTGDEEMYFFGNN